MGLPVLNFKFLPDRCHWGRNSSCLQRQEGAAGVDLAGPSLSEAATCSFFLERVTLPWCRCPALHSLQSSSQPLTRSHCSLDAHSGVNGGWWLRDIEASAPVTQHGSRRGRIWSQV